MPPVDVTVATHLAVPRERVAAFAGDPANAPAWYANIRSVRPHGAPVVAVGARTDFVAHFLGRELAYTYEIRELLPGRRLVMNTDDGPFPMETTYTWWDEDGGTGMSLRNRGRPRDVASLGSALLAAAVRRATGKDLARLRALLEEQDRDRP
ncbi:SRPBCC family protein [Ornithinimicrobium sp. W1679]|uniref:SRPBCC family protein n=1 Tax=Ornithinimicrobium sp. W1679 TaxID=3418770 RepID=UPI003CF2B8B2